MTECSDEEDNSLLSITEPEEVRLFIDEYMKDTGIEDAGLTRNSSTSLIADYARKDPVRRVHLKEFVDRHIEIQIRSGRV